MKQSLKRFHVRIAAAIPVIFPKIPKAPETKAAGEQTSTIHQHLKLNSTEKISTHSSDTVTIYTVTAIFLIR